MLFLAALMCSLVAVNARSEAEKWQRDLKKTRMSRGRFDNSRSSQGRYSVVSQLELPKCIIDGVEYTTFDTIPTDNDCEFCSCAPNGEKVCATPMCEPPQCVDPDMSVGCCGACPNGPNCAMKDGTILTPGDLHRDPAPDADGCTADCFCPHYGTRARCLRRCPEDDMPMLD